MKGETKLMGKTFIFKGDGTEIQSKTGENKMPKYTNDENTKITLEVE